MNGRFGKVQSFHGRSSRTFATNIADLISASGIRHITHGEPDHDELTINCSKCGKAEIAKVSVARPPIYGNAHRKTNAGGATTSISW